MPEGKYKGIRPSDYYLDETDITGRKKPFPENMPLEYYFKLLKDDQFPQISMGYGDGKGNSFDDHDSWDDCPAAQAEIRSLVQKLMKDEAVWGKVPSKCQAIIRAAQRSKVQWQNQLRQYLGMLVSAKNTPYLKTYDRRYGWPFPGTRPQYMDRVLVSVDTSRSVSDAQLSQILTEINAIHEHYAVDLIMHDAALSYGPKPFDQKVIKFEVHGRGGTSFKPSMEVAKKGRYNALIMLTDGEGDIVDYPEGVREVIWILIDSKYCPVPWGKKITIPSDDHYDMDDDDKNNSLFPYPKHKKSIFPTTLFPSIR
jgi:predicted metal-dependent peptidase